MQPVQKNQILNYTNYKLSFYTLCAIIFQKLEAPSING